jgi:hypothetical protein
MTVYPRMWHYEAETRSNVEQSFSDSLQISFGPAGFRGFSVILVDGLMPDVLSAHYWTRRFNFVLPKPADVPDPEPYELDPFQHYNHIRV